MKLQGKYDFNDFVDLYFNKYYFNSKQNLATRALLTLGIIILIVEAFLFIFLNDVYTVVNTYLNAKFITFLVVFFSLPYVIKPKIFYENYKKQYRPDNYIEVDEKEFKLYAGKEIRIEMNKLTNTAVLKHGYFLDFDESFVFYIPHRFFRSTEDLRFFNSIVNKSKAS